MVSPEIQRIAGEKKPTAVDGIGILVWISMLNSCKIIVVSNYTTTQERQVESAGLSCHAVRHTSSIAMTTSTVSRSVQSKVVREMCALGDLREQGQNGSSCECKVAGCHTLLGSLT